MRLPLCKIKAGQKATVAEVTAEGEVGRRIRDMGLMRGATLEVLGHAPLGDPVALRVGGTTLALRRHEADLVTVEVEA